MAAMYKILGRVSADLDSSEAAAPLSDVEKAFADFSKRRAAGEAIGQGELDDKLNPVQQLMLAADADGSGTFSIAEVEAVVRSFEEQTKSLQAASAPPLTEAEATFSDLSTRTLKGETIAQSELDEKLSKVQQLMLRHDVRRPARGIKDGPRLCSFETGGRGDAAAATRTIPRGPGSRRRRGRDGYSAGTGFAATPRPRRG